MVCRDLSPDELRYIFTLKDKDKGELKVLLAQALSRLDDVCTYVKENNLYFIDDEYSDKPDDRDAKYTILCLCGDEDAEYYI